MEKLELKGRSDQKPWRKIPKISKKSVYLGGGEVPEKLGKEGYERRG